MSEPVSEADRVLQRLRASANPRPEVARQVLAGVEGRLALGIDAGAMRPGGAARTTRWAQLGRVALRLGRWGTFGIVAGAIGYHLGLTSQERAAHDAGALTARNPSGEQAPPLPAASVESALPASGASKRAAPVEPSLHALAPATPLPSADAPPTPTGAARPLAAVTRRAAAPKPTSPPRARSTGEHATHTEPTSGLAAVLERLHAAQSSLRESDPHAALAQLEALDEVTAGASLAASGLAEERLVLRVLALCDLGRLGEARQVLAELDAAADPSIYRGRLKQSCSALLDP